MTYNGSSFVLDSDLNKDILYLKDQKTEFHNFTTKDGKGFVTGYDIMDHGYGLNNECRVTILKEEENSFFNLKINYNGVDYRKFLLI